MRTNLGWNPKKCWPFIDVNENKNNEIAFSDLFCLIGNFTLVCKCYSRINQLCLVKHMWKLRPWYSISLFQALSSPPNLQKPPIDSSWLSYWNSSEKENPSSKAFLMICLITPWIVSLSHAKINKLKKFKNGPAKFYVDEEKFRYLLDLHLTSTIPQLLIARPVELNFTSLSAKNVLAAMY